MYSGTVRPPPLYPLTAVRFLAAFCVVVFHFGGDLLPHLPVAARLIFERGYISVSFFFVLSGFILAYTYLAGTRPFPAGRFFRARFARIYPVFLLAFLLEGFLVIGGKTPFSTGTVAIT